MSFQACAHFCCLFVNEGHNTSQLDTTSLLLNYCFSYYILCNKIFLQVVKRNESGGQMGSSTKPATNGMYSPLHFLCSVCVTYFIEQEQTDLVIVLHIAVFRCSIKFN